MTSFITTMSVHSPLPLQMRVSHTPSPMSTLHKMSSIILDALHDISSKSRRSSEVDVVDSPRPKPESSFRVIHPALREDERSHVDSCDRNARTRGPFKPRNANKGTSSYQLRQFAEATLGSGSLRKAVRLPEGEDLNEWLAVNGLCPVIIRFDGLFGG